MSFPKAKRFSEKIVPTPSPADYDLRAFNSRFSTGAIFPKTNTSSNASIYVDKKSELRRNEIKKSSNNQENPRYSKQTNNKTIDHTMFDCFFEIREEFFDDDYDTFIPKEEELLGAKETDFNKFWDFWKTFTLKEEKTSTITVSYDDLSSVFDSNSEEAVFKEFSKDVEEYRYEYRPQPSARKHLSPVRTKNKDFFDAISSVFESNDEETVNIGFSEDLNEYRLEYSSKHSANKYIPPVRNQNKHSIDDMSSVFESNNDKAVSKEFSEDAKKQRHEYRSKPSARKTLTPERIKNKASFDNNNEEAEYIESSEDENAYRPEYRSKRPARKTLSPVGTKNKYSFDNISSVFEAKNEEDRNKEFIEDIKEHKIEYRSKPSARKTLSPVGTRNKDSFDNISSVFGSNNEEHVNEEFIEDAKEQRLDCSSKHSTRKNLFGFESNSEETLNKEFSKDVKEYRNREYRNKEFSDDVKEYELDYRSKPSARKSISHTKIKNDKKSAITDSKSCINLAERDKDSLENIIRDGIVKLRKEFQNEICKNIERQLEVLSDFVRSIYYKAEEDIEEKCEAAVRTLIETLNNGHIKSIVK